MRAKKDSQSSDSDWSETQDQDFGAGQQVSPIGRHQCNVETCIIFAHLESAPRTLHSSHYTA